LGDSSELQALQREVDALRGELVDSRSRHSEELAQLGTDLKASQAREAQTVIAAQLAEDELTAVRADHDVTREALRTTRSQGDAGQVDLEAANAAFDNSLKASARELAAIRAERDALRQLLNEVDAKEAALAADWDAERRALQHEIRTVRESAADTVRKLEDRLEAKESELAVTQQELLDAEMRRAEEAASFLQALQE